MNKKQLIKILRKEFKGEKISLRQLSKELNLDFDKLYSLTSALESDQIVTLRKFEEIGRIEPLEVWIDSFTSPKKESILRHPLFIAICAAIVIATLNYWVFPEVRKKIDCKARQYEEYSNRRNIAYSIYPEVLGNVNKINVYISKPYSKQKLETINIKFATKLYELHYKTGIFGGGELDKQLANFYNGLNSVGVGFKKADLERMKAQGISVLQMLEKDYGCRDYDKMFSSDSPKEMMAVSSDTVTLVTTPMVASGVVVTTSENKDYNGN